MKKVMSVYSEHNNTVFAVGFTRCVVLCESVTVFVATSHSEPSAVVMIIGFPDQSVAQVGVPHLRGENHLAVPVCIVKLRLVFEFDVRASAELHFGKALGVVELLEQIF